MTALEEKIAAGHDPAVIEPFQRIRECLQQEHPDLIPDLVTIVDQHERIQRRMYGLESKVNNLGRNLYMKRGDAR